MRERSLDALEVVAFDVNETLVDLEPMRWRFVELGAPDGLLDTWFAATLRDGFALTAAGGYADFPHIATAVLRGLLGRVDSLTVDPAAGAERIVAGFPDLPLHADVEPGLRALHETGLRLVSLSNGTASLSERLLAPVADLLEHRLTVQSTRRWKPAPEPYLHAAGECGVPPGRMLMVATHPWDVDGAKRAGMSGAWLNRRGGDYPDPFSPPDVVAGDLTSLATILAARSAR